MVRRLPRLLAIVAILGIAGCGEPELPLADDAPATSASPTATLDVATLVTPSPDAPPTGFSSGTPLVLADAALALARAAVPGRDGQPPRIVGMRLLTRQELPDGWLPPGAPDAPLWLIALDDTSLSVPCTLADTSSCVFNEVTLVLDATDGEVLIFHAPPDDVQAMPRPELPPDATLPTADEVIAMAQPGYQGRVVGLRLQRAAELPYRQPRLAPDAPIWRVELAELDVSHSCPVDVDDPARCNASRITVWLEAADGGELGRTTDWPPPTFPDTHVTPAISREQAAEIALGFTREATPDLTDAAVVSVELVPDFWDGSTPRPVWIVDLTGASGAARIVWGVDAMTGEMAGGSMEGPGVADPGIDASPGPTTPTHPPAPTPTAVP